MAQNGETKIQNSALLAVGQRSDVLAMRLQSGVFRAYDDPDKIVRIGQPGLPDTMMLVATQITPEMVGKTIAVAVAAEIKTARGRQSEAQRNWQAAFEARGGVYRLIRSPDEMVALADEVQRGKW
jgi:hypothetical protein